MDYYFQLFSFLVAPFAWPSSVQEKMWREVLRDLAVWTAERTREAALVQ